MKIAYIVTEYPKVSHSFIRREIAALERQGFEIFRISLRGWTAELPDEEDQRERTRTRYVVQGGPSILIYHALRAIISSPLRFCRALRLTLKLAGNSDRTLPSHLIYLTEACRILSWLSASQVQHVHAHFGTNSAEIAMLTRVLGGPTYSFTVHGPDEFLCPMGLEEKIHRSNFTVAISSFGRSQLYLRTHHLDWHRIKVVHCGLERSFYDPEVQRLSMPSRLVCVGRLCEAKGQLLLMQAAAILKSRGVYFELVLAGDGPMRQSLEAAIVTHGLAEQVRITGWISSNAVREEILSSRALVLPSFAEGLPVVIMEAMALRRPVITTFVAGIPELVRDGQNGWLVPAGSLDQLVAALEDCLASTPERIRSLGDAAYEVVIARHAIDVETEKLANLFRATGLADTR